MTFDTIIKGGRWFDGTGAPSATRNLGIRDGVVAEVSAEPLDETGCEHVVDATDRWVLPGTIDVHTHYDVEVLNGPDLSESLRHGVTTVFMGSCSLSTIYVDGTDAGDLFGRVEAIPREHVIMAVDATKSWSNATEYAAALERLALGPNLAAFIGHSDMRTAVMGLDNATRHEVKPTGRQQRRMEEMLTEAIDAGFLGLSSQQLLFDKLDGEVCRSRTLPSTYAKSRELRRLNAILRRRDRVLQSGPDIKNPLSVVSQLVTSLGIGRKRLKTSLLSAADIKALPFVVHGMGPMARLVNRLGGNFRWQHLPVPFEVYADGIDLVIFEEFGSGAAALHLQDEVARDTMLRDEDYRRQFRKDYEQKYGPRVWHRDFFDADIVECPDASVIGKSFGQVGVERGRPGAPVHPVDAFLDLVLEHGKALRWRTTISNHRPELLKKLAADSGVQMGFSDAGAHLRNMAFYNMGLRLLRHVVSAERAGKPFMTVEHAVHRLTGELADWYSLDAGHLRVGDRADLMVLDPDKLDDSLDAYAECPVEQYAGLSRMVNRNDDTLDLVMVGGRAVFEHGRPAAVVGHERTGSFLRVGTRTPAPARPAAPVTPSHPSRPSMSADPVDARERILVAASRCLAELGADRTSISAVAREAGVSRQTVHAHVGSRERLVRDALRYAARAAGDRMLAVALQQPTAGDFLVELCVLAVDEFTANPAISPLMGELATDDGRGRMLREENLVTAVVFLAPLLDYDPDLVPRMDEIAETFLRFELSLLAFPSDRTATAAARRTYLRRTMLPALGLIDVTSRSA